MHCDGLTTINYKGSESDWNSITKSDGWDKDAGAFVGGYTVVYNYQG